MKRIIAGDYVFTKQYTGNPEKAMKSHQQTRAKKKNPTRDEVKRYNRRMRVERLQTLIILNFKGGFVLTLEYGEDSQPQDYKSADNTMMQFLRGIKRELRNKSKDFKYISVTERGHEREHLHHHVLVDSQETADLLRRKWNHGNVHVKKTHGEDNAYLALAEYLLKDDTKEEKPKGSSYHASRNLKQPTIERELHAGAWREEPAPEQGFEILTESVRNGFYEPLGIRYRSYTQKRKIDPSERQKEGIKIRRGVALFKNTLKHDYKKKLERAANGIKSLFNAVI